MKLSSDSIIFRIVSKECSLPSGSCDLPVTPRSDVSGLAPAPSVP